MSRLFGMTTVAERSKVLVTSGVGQVVTRASDGTLHSSADVFYLQPNDGKLAPKQAKGTMLRRWVEFPRKGVLPATPMENLSSSVMALYVEGPPILAEEEIPMSAGWASPLKAAFFTTLAVGAGFVFYKRAKPARQTE